MNTTYVFESIIFFFYECFFKGLSAKDVKSYLITDSWSDAYEFSFEENLSSPYEVWRDVIVNYIKYLKVHDKFDDVEEVVNEDIANLQTQHAGILFEYRKKKLKKSTPIMMTFYFLMLAKMLFCSLHSGNK